MIRLCSIHNLSVSPNEAGYILAVHAAVIETWPRFLESRLVLIED